MTHEARLAENLSAQHAIEKDALVHTQMKSVYSIPRLASSWVTNPCDCTPVEQLKVRLGLAHRDFLLAALEAVLGLHKEDESKALGGGDFMEIEGYNRALSDVRTRITEALGVTS